MAGYQKRLLLLLLLNIQTMMSAGCGWPCVP